VWRARGNSWLRSNPGEFAFVAALSIPLWMVFEGYNQLIDNWYYTGLPESPLWRYFGYAWSFSTIWPAIFEGAELVAVLRAGKAGGAGGYSHPALPALCIAAGALMLAGPFVATPAIARYLAAPIWLGFIFLLDPINARLGGPSLIADFAARRYDRSSTAGWVDGMRGDGLEGEERRGHESGTAR